MQHHYNMIKLRQTTERSTNYPQNIAYSKIIVKNVETTRVGVTKPISPVPIFS